MVHFCLPWKFITYVYLASILLHYFAINYHKNSQASFEPISAGDAMSSYEVRSTQMGIDHALSMLRNGKDVAILLDVNGANLAANFSYILLLSNLGDPV